MEYEYGQCSDPNTRCEDDGITLASSCPKKKAGRKKFKETRHPVYRGVRQRNGNRWVCEVRAPNDQTRIWLGTYPTPEMAARAHDVAALALRGRNACLNFADSAWRLPVPASNDTRDIQRAAAEAAELFRPQDGSGHAEAARSDDHVRRSTGGVQAEGSGSYGDGCSGGSGGGYVDEEAVFDMPGLLVNMAEGMLLPPPYSSQWDEPDSDTYGDVSLWSYSF